MKSASSTQEMERLVGTNLASSHGFTGDIGVDAA
jgi:hypothetical protein